MKLGVKRAWREGCTLGQVLFYLVGHQLEALTYQKNPCPKLGIYMEDDAVRMISVHASILYRISFNHVAVANCGRATMEPSGP